MTQYLSTVIDMLSLHTLYSMLNNESKTICMVGVKFTILIDVNLMLYSVWRETFRRKYLEISKGWKSDDTYQLYGQATVSRNISQ